LAEAFIKVDKWSKNTKCRVCPFFKKKKWNPREPILIPSPKKPKMMIVSRDPTTDFLPDVHFSRGFSREQRRMYLFQTAIPHGIIVKFSRHIRLHHKKNQEADIRALFKLYDVAYWTHWHKCPTDSNADATSVCAETYLGEEIDNAIKVGITCIMAVGRDAERCVKKLRDQELKTKKVDIVYIPHPSGRTTTWEREPRTVEVSLKGILKHLR
jgi:uracil-DNA glycosylase